MNYPSLALDLGKYPGRLGAPETPLHRDVINGNGGAEGDRTPDLSHAMRTLSQLSYGPIPVGRRVTNRTRPGWQAA